MQTELQRLSAVAVSKLPSPPIPPQDALPSNPRVTRIARAVDAERVTADIWGRNAF
jgi:hypothetical protein